MTDVTGCDDIASCSKKDKGLADINHGVTAVAQGSALCSTSPTNHRALCFPKDHGRLSIRGRLSIDRGSYRQGALRCYRQVDRGGPETLQT